jgi:hypothetical protein
MALATLLDRLQLYLQETLSAEPMLLGGAYPTAAEHLPAVTLSIADAAERLPGVGRIPAPTAQGALRIEETFSLADPVLAFPGDPVSIVSDDRRTVIIPHGPVVREDGTADQPFAVGDFRLVVNGTPFTPVSEPPGAQEVRVVPLVGELHVADPLPASGTLALGYFVGEWEVRTFRYAGALSVEVFGAEAGEVDALSRQVETALREAPEGRVHGLSVLSATAWGPVGGGLPAPGEALRRQFRYRFDYELIEPRLGTAGGPIQTIAVTSSQGPETFDVTRQRSPDG